MPADVGVARRAARRAAESILSAITLMLSGATTLVKIVVPRSVKR
ncbi:hypothetical protein [Mycobacterium kyorinense]|nr:hypothetical protein [Mycobacterium kyorinense]